MSKTYKIPLTYSVLVIHEVEADTLQEAVDKAVKIELNTYTPGYLSDSLEVDDLVEDNYPGEPYTINY